MASVVIVSGCPGSGKSTLARSLARSASRGLHLHSDVFYTFASEPIDPTHPESHHQNTVIMRALAASARTFAEGGYHVVLDGVIGPWFLPVLREGLSGISDVSYLVLRASEAEAIRRVRQREGPGESARVRHMVSAFARSDVPAVNEIDTERRSPDEVLAIARAGLAEGRFRISP